MSSGLMMTVAQTRQDDLLRTAEHGRLAHSVKVAQSNETTQRRRAGRVLLRVLVALGGGSRAPWGGSSVTYPTL
jgi:hypothetical protein